MAMHGINTLIEVRLNLALMHGGKCQKKKEVKKMLYQMSKFPRWLDYKNRHTDERQKPIDHRKLETESSVEALKANFLGSCLCVVEKEVKS